MIVPGEGPQNRMETNGKRPLPAETLLQGAPEARQVKVIDRHIGVLLLLETDAPGGRVEQQLVVCRYAQLPAGDGAFFGTILHQHVVLRVAAFPDGSMEVEAPPEDDGQVVRVGNEHVRHVRGVLEEMGFDTLGGHVAGHVAGDALDAQTAVPGFHVELVLPFHEIIRFHAIVRPNPGGGIFIQLTERPPAHRPHPGRQLVGIAGFHDPDNVRIWPELVQLLHNETLVVVVAPPAGDAGDDLVLLDGENPQQVEQHDNHPRHHRPRHRPDEAPNFGPKGHSNKGMIFIDLEAA